MVIPMPFSMPASSTPTNYALDTRPKIIFLLVLQYYYAVCAMIGPAPVNNTATSLMLLLTAALGTYAVWDGVDVRMVLFWAVLGLMNGISGLALFIDASMKGDALKMLFSTGSAYVIGLGAVCVCIVPIAMLCPIYYASTHFSLWKSVALHMR